MSRFIFVHGGSHRAWCWESTADLLKAKGHEARAIDLPGRDDPTADVTLDDWVARLGAEVDEVLADGGPPPTVVAHSMGGLTASQFAERRPNDLYSLVFVCAVAPVDGQSGLEALAEAGQDSVLLQEGSSIPAADGRTVIVDPDAARRAFYNLCPPDVAAAAVARICPEHVRPLATPLELGSGFASVAKRWIGASEDRTVPLALQKKMAEQMGAPMSTLQADHSPFLSATGELVELLEQ